jgi:UDP-N-acetylglucosamine--N-acetylmuramyl-(pentapeptide) pyrophosphoryl-undecaprenol N-acetylglucosamine transferase
MHLPTAKDGAVFYNINEHIPTIFVYAGSLGAEKINNLIMQSLSELLKSYQIIHQCGSNNYEMIKSQSEVILESHPYKNRYILKPFLNAIDTRNAAAVSSLVVSRGGSTLFEIATWHIPAIVIPITHSNGNHQHKKCCTLRRNWGWYNNGRSQCTTTSFYFTSP